MATVAIAFSLATPGITAPIVGGSKAAHITEAAEAIHFRLTADELESVKKLYKPKAIVCRDFQPLPFCEVLQQHFVSADKARLPLQFGHS